MGSGSKFRKMQQRRNFPSTRLMHKSVILRGTLFLIVPYIYSTPLVATKHPWGAQYAVKIRHAQGLVDFKLANCVCIDSGPKASVEGLGNLENNSRVWVSQLCTENFTDTLSLIHVHVQPGHTPQCAGQLFSYSQTTSS